MTMPPAELVLLRHAEARPPHGRQDDFDRVLSARGEADAARLGDWLRVQALLFDRVLCSPAVRARSTLAVALPQWVVAAQLLPQLYLADAAVLHALLAAQAPSSRLLLVGHNPGLEHLAQTLCGAPLPGALHTCGLLRLRAQSERRYALIEAWQP
jgi:phosphohistidine phosphatase